MIWGLAPVLANPNESGIPQADLFGDHLTDAGAHEFRFITNPGQTWAQCVASDLGQADVPHEHIAALQR